MKLERQPGSYYVKKFGICSKGNEKPSNTIKQRGDINGFVFLKDPSGPS